MTNGRVIYCQRGVNRCGDIFRVDRTLFRPSRIFDVGAVRRRFPQHTSTTDTTTRKKRGMDEIVVAALLRRDVSDGAAEFAFHNNERFIKQRFSIAARYQR